MFSLTKQKRDGLRSIFACVKAEVFDHRVMLSQSDITGGTDSAAKKIVQLVFFGSEQGTRRGL